jgi:hypothetical protein
MLKTVVVEHYMRTLGGKKLRSSATALGWFRDDLPIRRIRTSPLPSNRVRPTGRTVISRSVPVTLRHSHLACLKAGDVQSAQGACVLVADCRGIKRTGANKHGIDDPIRGGGDRVGGDP